MEINYKTIHFKVLQHVAKKSNKDLGFNFIKINFKFTKLWYIF